MQLLSQGLVRGWETNPNTPPHPTEGDQSSTRRGLELGLQLCHGNSQGCFEENSQQGGATA